MKSGYAITYTSKDELRFLKYAIPFHRAQGCRRFYIFLDNTTDGTEAHFAGQSDVEVSRTVQPDVIPNKPAWAQNIEGKHGENMLVRKRLNTLHAADRAAAEGIEWIVGIDADELLYVPGATFGEAIADIGYEADQVLMRNVELLPRPSKRDNPFADQVLFLRRHRISEEVLRWITAGLRKASASPLTIAKFESSYYRHRFGGNFPPVLVNPIDGSKIYRGYFLGYNNYKSAMRTNRARGFNFNIHQWTKSDKVPRNAFVGTVLHYDFPNSEYFIKKFQMRASDSFRKEFDTRYQLSQIARSSEPGLAENFYNTQICETDERKIADLISRGIAERITQPAEFFEEQVSTSSTTQQ